ncbi:MAG: glycosyltransferase family 2 protein [Chloroflexi bacterium]|nr:glycosyltransferase family 2 protein [Chloroflexota bacterium]
MARSEPLVSVVIPVYNGERFLGEALESVCWQTYRKFEVIVVDDGSTDATRDVVEGWPSVRRLQQPHRGVSAARNAGVAAARGALLAFLDADDLWTPDKLAVQVESLEHEGAPALVVGLHRFFADGAWPAWIRPGLLADEHPGWTPSSWLMRRETFECVGPFDEALVYGEDLDWISRARSREVPSRVAGEVLVLKRLHDANLAAKAAANPRPVLGLLRQAAHRADARRREGQVTDGPQ